MIECLLLKYPTVYVSYGTTNNSFSTLDMASPEGQRLAMQGGLLFPPGILIDGKPFSYGRLSERKLRRELDRQMGFVERSPYVLALQDVHA
jgi:hypothetical protein